MLGWRCVCAVELDPFARSVLLARQDDGQLPAFPVWDDVTTFDAHPWRGLVDVVSGGFPCTDISVAGRGAGIDGEHSGLWAHMARVIRDVRPRFVFVENSPALVTRGLGRVLGDLAALGYDAEWGVLGAGDVGANHRRERIWIVAHAHSDRRDGRPRRGVVGAGWVEPPDGGGDAPNPDGRRELQPQGRIGEVGGRATHGGDARHADGSRLEKRKGEPGDDGPQLAPAFGANRRAAEPGVRRTDDGLAHQLDTHSWGDWRGWIEPATVGKLADRASRLKCLGNGQVPQCAAEAWRQLVARGGW